MAVSKSIAIIGEGETEWFYFDTLRIACRYPFKLAPDFPQHSDIPHMAKMAEEKVKAEYDYVVCLVDMDRLLQHPKELETYKQIKKKSSENILWVETNPCTEFWFLLHFMPQLSMRHYQTYEDLLPELQRYMPGYEKTIRYFRRNNLYTYLTTNGDINRAIDYSKELSRLSEATPEDKIAYSQIHEVFELIASIQVDSINQNRVKSGNQKRNDDYRRQIMTFIADNEISDAKSVSKAIGLKPSRTRDYLKQLVEIGELEIVGEFKNRKYKIVQK